MKRKSIVIGETYIYDPLNETDMAAATTMVTVIKKSRHGFMIRSVNNGDCFESKAEYLVPYVSPEEAKVVRCQYGTTDIDYRDIDTLKTLYTTICLQQDCIKKLCDTLKVMHCDDSTINTLISKVDESVDINKNSIINLASKLKVYADISKFKADIAEEHIKKEVNYDLVNDKLRELTEEYIAIDSTMSYEEFIEEAQYICKKYAKPMKQDIFINNNIINAIAEDIMDTYGTTEGVPKYVILLIYRSKVTGNILVSEPVELDCVGEIATQHTREKLRRTIRQVYPIDGQYDFMFASITVPRYSSNEYFEKEKEYYGEISRIPDEELMNYLYGDDEEDDYE